MRISTLEVRFDRETGSTIDIEFDVTALIEATDERRFEWLLEYDVSTFGTQPWRDNMSLPVTNTHNGIVSHPQRPRRLSQGDSWRTTWTTTVQKSDITVPDNDSYQFAASLRPVVDVNPSPKKVDVVSQDID